MLFLISRQKISACLLALLTGVGLRAEPAPFRPALSIRPIPPEKVAECAALVGRINPAMKTGHGVPLFLRLYAGEATGESAGAFLLSPAPSFADLTKNEQAFANDPGLAELGRRLEAIAGLGSRTLLKAVRFDGTHAPGWLYNTLVVVPDEAAYLKTLDQLRALLDRHGLEDARLNAFRVVAGRATYTHLVSLNTPSAARLAAVLDTLATAPWAARWIADSDALRTVVHNGTYRELVP